MMLGWIVLLNVLIGFVYADTPLGCDPKWTNYNGYCYFFNTQQNMSWSNAETECNIQDAGLLRIESPDELQWFIQTAKSNPAAGYWTALNDRRLSGAPGGTGVWMFGIDEYPATGVLQWSKEPTNDQIENCGGVNIQGKFDDQDCNVRQGYICEIDGTTDTGCPFGWMITDTDCFWFSDPTNTTQLVTWDQARKLCTGWTPLPGKTAQLITLDNPSDSTYLQSQMLYLPKLTTRYWTGLQRATGNTWKWYNGDTFTAGYISWAQEPDNLAGKEQCGMIKMNGLFSDQDCNANHYFVCRKSEDYAVDLMNMGCGIWQRAGKKCYMFYNQPKTTWQKARQQCQAIGGDLLNVRNADEKDWVTWQMTIPDVSYPFWTGLNDQSQQGSYVWGDGSSANMSLIKWNQEPNDWEGMEDCASIHNNGLYNDMVCSSKAFAICEANVTARAGWITRPGYKDYYKFIAQPFTWMEAKAYCTAQTARLLAVNDQNEKTWIESQLAKMPDNPQGWWTGLNDRQGEGTWTYPETPTLPANLGVIPWVGEPDDKNHSQNCVFMMWGGRYFDSKCTDQIGFICQKNPNGAEGPFRTNGGLVVTLLLFCAAVGRIH